MPIDVIISPEKEVANVAIKRLQAPSAFETESFLDGSAQLLGLKLAEDCAVLETPLRQLSELFSTLEAIVVGIRRNRTLFIPKPEDQLFAGYEVYIFCSKNDVVRIFEIFGKILLEIEISDRRFHTLPHNVRRLLWRIVVRREIVILKLLGVLTVVSNRDAFGFFSCRPT